MEGFINWLRKSKWLVFVGIAIWEASVRPLVKGVVGWVSGTASKAHLKISPVKVRHEDDYRIVGEPREVTLFFAEVRNEKKFKWWGKFLCKVSSIEPAKSCNAQVIFESETSKDIYHIELKGQSGSYAGDINYEGYRTAPFAAVAEGKGFGFIDVTNDETLEQPFEPKSWEDLNQGKVTLKITTEQKPFNQTLSVKKIGELYKSEIQEG